MADAGTNRIVDYYREMESSFASWGGGEGGAMHYGHHDSPEAPHLGSLTRMNEVLAALVGVAAGDRVLDAGCGVGNSAFWLARERGAAVLGISLSPLQVEQANRHARRLELAERVEFLERDYRATSLATASFDVVWAVESLCHAEDKSAFFAEAHRVLRPGGRLVVADYVLEAAERDDVAEYLLARWVSGWAIAPLWSWERLRAATLAAGFHEPRRIDLTDAIRPSAEEMFRRGKAGFPDDLVDKGKGLRQIAHVEACLHQKVALELGLWRYGVLVAER